jgi:very-short-patch-repair endonuclease
VHPLIDRHRAAALLTALAGATTLPAGRGRSRTEQSIGLIAQADSTLEADFVQWLKDHGYRLPDEAQTLVEAARARPDFIYRLASGSVAVFVDGPVHDDETVAERDQQACDRLEDAGWYVIRVRYDDDWQELAGANPTVFGAGR